MTSINAENVAKEVIANVRNGTKTTFRKIIPKHGYAPSIADHPKKVTTTESYQRVVRPLVIQLEEERQAIMERLPKVRDKAKYRDLMDGLDKVTKTHQLLTGGATENLAVLGVEINVRKNS